MFGSTSLLMESLMVDFIVWPAVVMVHVVGFALDVGLGVADTVFKMGMF